MQIIRGKLNVAQKIVIYGPEGIGKSSFAACFPHAIFIDTEGSTKHLDVSRTQRPGSFSLLLEQVRYFIAHPKELSTLVVDTADWAEQLCIADLCARHQNNGIEDFGYGKGYVYLVEDFGKLLNLLEELIERSVNVVITAHAKMRKFEQPDEMGAYDRWELKLSKNTAPLLKEWADMVLFANYETITVKRDDGKIKAQGSGKRVMYTEHHSCWDAKNRHGLANKLPFAFASIAHCIPQAGQEQAAPAPVSVPVPPSADEVQLEAPAPVIEKDTQVQEDRLAPHLEQLSALLNSIGASDEELRSVVSQRGYFPYDMPVHDYPVEFVKGVLIGAWEQVAAMLKELQPLPFK